MRISDYIDADLLDRFEFYVYAIVNLKRSNFVYL